MASGLTHRRGGLMLAVVLASVTVGAARQPPPDQSLPDLQDLLPRIRATLRADADLFSRYRYRQRITSRERGPDGAIVRTTVREYEVRPNAWGAPAQWVLLRVDGRPVPRARINESRRKNRERLEGSPEKIARWRRAAAEQQAEIEKAIDEVFRTVDARSVGRVMRNGHAAIEIAFQPRPDADATTSIGKLFRKTRGRVWVNETDGQLIRFEGEAIETILYGWGVVARVHAGTRLEFERRLVDDEAWLPASYLLQGSARMLLFKVDRFDRQSEFFEYQRIDATATASAR